MAETIPVTWLTQEAHDRLQAELAHLSGPGRAEITSRIDAARQEGDLKENGGYHAAKDEQGKMEARIRQLELLRTAKVGEAPTTSGVVAPGTVVTATVAGKDMTFLLGSREVGEGTRYDVYSERSPLGAAILGKRAGESATYSAPSGKQIAVTVVSVEPFSG
jgi:transcription elongation factor GreA